MKGKKKNGKQSKFSSKSSAKIGHSDGFIAVYEIVKKSHKRGEQNGNRIQS